jgi:hypothetical protein
MNASKIKLLMGNPDPTEEIFLYQTLLGVWPLNLQDILGHLNGFKLLIKSVREAQIHSRWVDPNNDYEQNLLQFAKLSGGEGGKRISKGIFRPSGPGCLFWRLKFPVTGAPQDNFAGNTGFFPGK